jgi:hypothetical protein
MLGSVSFYFWVYYAQALEFIDFFEAEIKGKSKGKNKVVCYQSIYLKITRA